MVTHAVEDATDATSREFPQSIIFFEDLATSPMPNLVIGFASFASADTQLDRSALIN